MRCTSGRFEVIACAIRCSMMVLPALGGEVMRPRAPRPIGAMRSRTRPTSSSGRVSMMSFSVGSVAVRFWKWVRRATAMGSVPSTVSTRARVRFMLRSVAWPFTSDARLQVHPLHQPARHLDVERLRQVAPLRIAQPADALPLELEDALHLLGDLGLRLRAWACGAPFAPGR